MTHPLPFVCVDPMQAVIETDGLREWHQQRAQERLDAEYERTPASERPLWPPTFFPGPDNDASSPSTRHREEHRPAPAHAMTSPPARAGATVPTTPKEHA